MAIKHLKHSDIDKDLWDDKIYNSTNGVLYALSWYLDVVSPGWEALVEENYSQIMPLPVKSKYGFKYLVQPLYSQQLGIFSKTEILENQYQNFIKAIPYKFYRLQLNSKNCYNQNKQNRKPNYILSLENSYEEIISLYNQNCKRNLKKTVKFNQKIVENISKEKFMEFVEKNLVFNKTKDMFSTLSKLIDISLKNGTAKLLSVVSEQKEEIIATVFLVSWKNRIYYLMPSSSKRGKEWNSMFLIIDQLILQNSGKNVLIDFEGSSIDGVARFYKGFGATPEYYPLLNHNGLVFPFNKMVGK
jgi:hypothetical protein